MIVRETILPAGSRLTATLRRIDFIDAYEVALAHAGTSPLNAYAAIFGNEPAWARWLMKLRGKIVSLFRLAHDFDNGRTLDGDTAGVVPGMRVGPFTVRSVEPDELIVGDDDRHLDFRISVFRSERNGASFVTVSTAVEIHNFLGEGYMFVVKPFHRLIAKAMMRRAVAAGRL